MGQVITAQSACNAILTADLAAWANQDGPTITSRMKINWVIDTFMLRFPPFHSDYMTCMAQFLKFYNKENVGRTMTVNPELQNSKTDFVTVGLKKVLYGPTIWANVEQINEQTN